MPAKASRRARAVQPRPRGKAFYFWPRPPSLASLSPFKMDLPLLVWHRQLRQALRRPVEQSAIQQEGRHAAARRRPTATPSAPCSFPPCKKPATPWWMRDRTRMALQDFSAQIALFKREGIEIFNTFPLPAGLLPCSGAKRHNEDLAQQIKILPNGQGRPVRGRSLKPWAPWAMACTPGPTGTGPTPSSSAGHWPEQPPIGRWLRKGPRQAVEPASGCNRLPV